MIEHLQDRTVHGDMGIGRSRSQTSRSDAEHDKPHVIDGGVRHQAFEVRLTKGSERAKDDGGHCKQGKRSSEDPGLVRIEGQDKAQKTLGTQLEQHARQKHGPGGRGFGMGIGQPGVERPHRHLEGEGNGEGPEGNGLDRAG